MSVLIQFEYLYRDADNYKKWGEMCFDNPNNRLASSIERDIRSTLIDNTWFVAHQVQIPELFLFEDTTATHADHCYHEFIGIQPCVDDLPREKIEESIERLVARFKAASLKGWSAFNPRRHFM